MQVSNSKLTWLSIGASIGGLVGLAAASWNIENSTYVSPLPPAALTLVSIAYVTLTTLVFVVLGGVLGVAILRIKNCIKLGHWQPLIRKAALYAIVSPVLPLLRGDVDTQTVIQVACLGAFVGLIAAALNQSYAQTNNTPPQTLPPA